MYWPRSRLDQLSRRNLQVRYHAQSYMTYAANVPSNLDPGLVLREQPVWPLLCVCQQVHHEAAPLSLPNLHFSFSSVYVLSNALLLSQDMFLRKMLAVQGFAPELHPRVADLRMVGAFSRITSLQVRVEYGYGRNEVDTTSRLSGSALAKYVPKLQHLALDVSTAYVVSSRFCRGRASWRRSGV